MYVCNICMYVCICIYIYVYIYIYDKCKYNININECLNLVNIYIRYIDSYLQTTKNTNYFC